MPSNTYSLLPETTRLPFPAVTFSPFITIVDVVDPSESCVLVSPINVTPPAIAFCIFSMSARALASLILYVVPFGNVIWEIFGRSAIMYFSF